MVILQPNTHVHTLAFRRLGQGILIVVQPSKLHPFPLTSCLVHSLHTQHTHTQQTPGHQRPNQSACSCPGSLLNQRARERIGSNQASHLSPCYCICWAVKAWLTCWPLTAEACAASVHMSFYNSSAIFSQPQQETFQKLKASPVTTKYSNQAGCSQQPTTTRQTPQDHTSILMLDVNITWSSCPWSVCFYLLYNLYVIG